MADFNEDTQRAKIAAGFKSDGTQFVNPMLVRPLKSITHPGNVDQASHGYADPAATGAGTPFDPHTYKYPSSSKMK